MNRHQPTRYHVWDGIRCSICGKFKLGTQERFVQDFWLLVKAAGDCWEHQGAISRNGTGYPQAWGARGLKRNAHRVAYELASGEDPSALNVLHKCDNKKCVRPSHLFLGTQLENLHDMIRKGRKKTKLTLDQARAIFADTRRTMVIAREYGISRASVFRIRSRRQWAIVTTS